MSVAFYTEFKIQGFPSSSLYAPTPNNCFLGFLSALKSYETPRIGSNGEAGTLDQTPKLLIYLKNDEVLITYLIMIIFIIKKKFEPNKILK